MIEGLTNLCVEPLFLSIQMYNKINLPEVRAFLLVSSSFHTYFYFKPVTMTSQQDKFPEQHPGLQEVIPLNIFFIWS